MKKLSPNLKNLIAILNDGKVHSGSSLGEQLNISRNAIWKHVKQLIKYGVAVKSVQSTGYQLEQPLILLDTQQIKKNITYHGKLTINKLDIFGSLDSTSTYLQQHPIKKFDALKICLAETQTAGRGRLGRAWYSPFGANIYLSCAWQVAKDMSELSGFSLVIALAVTAALKEFGINELSIKWPNDVLWRGQKLAGILLEAKAENHSITHIVFSVGLNVNMPVDAKKNINQAWTALNTIFAKPQDRNKVVGLIISHLLKNIDQIEQVGFASFIKNWQQYDHLAGEKITLYSGNQTIVGTVKGINAQGFLLLQRADGQITAYSSGDVSTKKLAPKA